MQMKNFARYLKYESFDKALHHVRQISTERTVETESLERRHPERKNPREKKTA